MESITLLPYYSADAFVVTCKDLLHCQPTKDIILEDTTAIQDYLQPEPPDQYLVLLVQF